VTAGDDDRVDRLVHVGQRHLGDDREAAAGGQRRGGDGRDADAVRALGLGEHLGGAGDVKHLDPGEGDDDDLPHRPIVLLRRRGRKDRCRTISATGAGWGR